MNYGVHYGLESTVKPDSAKQDRQHVVGGVESPAGEFFMQGVRLNGFWE